MVGTVDGVVLVQAPVTPMHALPDPASEQVSQALLGTPVGVLDRRGAWTRVRTPDGYEGWVEGDRIGAAPERWCAPWATPADPWIHLRSAPDSRRAPAAPLFAGTQVPLLDDSEGWSAVLLPDGSGLWTESQRLRPAAPLPRSRAELLRTARRFLGVPYLWGGCTALGIDCSGLVQLVYRLHGIELPRDARDQALQGGPAPEPRPGDLIFFGRARGESPVTHVGILVDSDRFLHALGGDRVRIDRLSRSSLRDRVFTIRTLF